ncbi:hypothetical protein KC363_g138 [Hortaea werneckii]|nr:hypothetical protein KC363_g138 [Hortaea werneckii]
MDDRVSTVRRTADVPSKGTRRPSHPSTAVCARFLVSPSVSVVSDVLELPDQRLLLSPSTPRIASATTSSLETTSLTLSSTFLKYASFAALLSLANRISCAVSSSIWEMPLFAVPAVALLSSDKVVEAEASVPPRARARLTRSDAIGCEPSNRFKWSPPACTLFSAACVALSSLPLPQAFASSTCAFRRSSSAAACEVPNTCVDDCAVSSTSLSVFCISRHLPSTLFSLALLRVAKAVVPVVFASLLWSWLVLSPSFDLVRINGSRAVLPSPPPVRDTESWEALCEGGPTKSEGAGRRLDLVFVEGAGLVGELDVVSLLDMIVLRCPCRSTSRVLPPVIIMAKLLGDHRQRLITFASSLPSEELSSVIASFLGLASYSRDLSTFQMPAY